MRTSLTNHSRFTIFLMQYKIVSLVGTTTQTSLFRYTTVATALLFSNKRLQNLTKPPTLVAPSSWAADMSVLCCQSMLLQNPRLLVQFSTLEFISSCCITRYQLPQSSTSLLLSNFCCLQTSPTLPQKDESNPCCFRGVEPSARCLRKRGSRPCCLNCPVQCLKR